MSASRSFCAGLVLLGFLSLPGSALAKRAPARTQPFPTQSTPNPSYTLPQSYYNSSQVLPVQNEETQRPLPTRREQSQPLALDQSQTQPPAVEPDTQTGELAPSQTRTNQPLAADYNTSYILTEIGALKAEIAELRAKKGEEPDENAGYDGGFFLKNDDNTFRLNINGRVQGRYSFNFAEDVQDGHTFSIRRVLLIFSGHAFSEKAQYSFVFLPQIATSLVDVDLYYDFFPEFSLHFFRSGLNFSGEGGDSSGKTMFIEKSLVSNRYEFADTLGVLASGSHKWFSYYAAVANGFENAFSTNANNELVYAMRLDFNVIGKVSGGQGDLPKSEKPGFTFGAAGIFGHNEDGTQARIIMGAGDFRFKYSGFSLYGGGVYRQTDPDEFTRAQTDIGFVAYAGYFFIPDKLEFGLRASTLMDDINDAGVNLNMGSSDITRLGGALSGSDVGEDSDNEWEYTAGFNYYFKGYNAKAQAQYTFMIDGIAGPDDLVNHIGMVQVQLGF